VFHSIQHLCVLLVRLPTSIIVKLESFIIHKKDKDKLLQCDDNIYPGQKVLIEQDILSVPDHPLPHTKGNEPKKDNYNVSVAFCT
jgi:hypothetical protein